MPKQWSQPPAMQIEPSKKYTAVFHTEKGDFTADLFTKEAPVTTNNFIFLARQGYYDNSTFHRVMHDFMAQAGDPEGTGRGGPGYTIPDEPSALALKHKLGSLSMANTGKPNSGGSQFFVTYIAPNWLDGKHAVFGQVISGMDVVKAIRERRDPDHDPLPGTKLASIEIIES